MHRFPIDDSTVERLLSGAVHPDDAPPGFAEVAALTRAARPPAAAPGSPLEQQVVAAFAARAPGLPAPGPTRRNRMLTKMLSVKVAAAAAGMMLAGGGVAAAATGALPTAMQSSLASGLSHVGISIPGGHGTSGSTAGTDLSVSADSGSGSGSVSGSASGQGSGSANAHGNNPTAMKADAFGQCTAYMAQQKHTTTTGTTGSGTSSTGSSTTKTHKTLPNLQADANAAKESIATFCAGVLATPGNSASPGDTASPDSSSTSTNHPTNGSTGETFGTSHAPSGTPAGPPSSTPAGPPSSVSTGQPSSTPAGPPSSVPAYGHASGSASGSIPGGVSGSAATSGSGTPVNSHASAAGGR